MPAENVDWKDLTPDSLISAVGHIRESFEEEEFKFGFLTQQMCYKELHPVAPAKAAPAVFKRHMDVYQAGLRDAAEKQFRELLQIGLANPRLLRQSPVEWTESHLELLITGKQYIVKRWIKNVCDRQELSKTTTPEEDMEEFIHWRSWRAPKLIHMQRAVRSNAACANISIQIRPVTAKIVRNYAARQLAKSWCRFNYLIYFAA